MKKINATVIGAAGYTGRELLKLLISHPFVAIVSAVSKSQAGKRVIDVMPELIGETDLIFSEEVDLNADVHFLCLQHGDAVKYLENNPAMLKSRVIDLSRDFRLKKNNHFDGADFVYGLPELNKEGIKTAGYIANPGCFATAIQLGLLPLAEAGSLKGNIHTTAITGSTGAGIKPSETTHFSWRQNNVSVYQEFVHPHNDEIIESLKQKQSNYDGEFLFVPQRGPFTRGIMATTLVANEMPETEVKQLFTEYYEEHFFTSIIDQPVDLKRVVNTNKCLIRIKQHKKHLLIVSVIDNLLKGAAGQAVQNMNLMFGIDEAEGLKLKSINY